LGLRDNQKSHLIEAVVPERNRDDVILSPANVRSFAALLDEFRQADRLRRHGLEIRTKLLFCGPPGCGKTITAEAFAFELALPLFVARLDAIVSSFLGETATNLRKVFEIASEQPCVLFLDEFDALARARTDSSEHNELRRVVNSLLQMIDRHKPTKGFLIAATNLEESLDSAIWRRFDEVVLFDPPKEREIRALLRLKTKNFPAEFNIDSKVQKLLGLSFADIERICVNAIKRSIIKDARRIGEADFNIALREEQRRQAIKAAVKKTNQEKTAT
jgi:SpoVK/Ycf46/Vps4 family AAA+-type ATPase